MADVRDGRPPRAWAIASSWRPAALTARWRFADSALRTRFSSPRSARETCRASTSRSAPVAPIRRRNVPTASPFFEVTTPRPRRMRHEAGKPDVREPLGQDRRLVGIDHELEVRPTAGEAERPPGQEAAAQPGRAAVVGGRPSSRTDAGVGPAIAAGDGPRAGRRTVPAGGRRAKTGQLGHAVARPRRVDRGQLVPKCGDEVALGAGHVRRSGVCAAPAAETGLVLERADERGREAGRIVVMRVRPGRRRRRG